MISKFNTKVPPVEIRENSDEYIIAMEFPGTEHNDIKIWQEKDALTITAEKKPVKGNRVFAERVFGAFTWYVKLPEDVNADGIKANYKNGVITLEIPKLENSKPKNIRIN